MEYELNVKALVRLWGKEEGPRFRPAAIAAGIILLAAGFVLWSTPGFWLR